jgi:two-component system phosphate regulon sensor histidine kinase PhoR
MPESSRKFLIGLSILLAAGALIGWFYGDTERGLLVASLLALIWQVRHLLAFARGLESNDFDLFRYGDGLWEQIFSRFSFERDRAGRYKSNYRSLLKEIRKSSEAMPDGSVIIDSNDEIVTCNKAAKALVGLKRKKDRGQRVDNILRDPAIGKLLQASDASKAFDIASPLKDNTWLNCRIVPYGAEQKMLIIRDVTDRLALSKMRRDFVANASHELRSPLTVVSGYLDMLAEDDCAPTDWVEPVSQMQAQAKRMNRIVSELLELSRLESSGPAGTAERVDVGALLKAAASAYGRPGSTANIVVEAVSDARLLGSRAEVESLISNLLSNAIRHTPADGQIDLSWCSDSDGAHLIVRDTGEGIGREHLPRLTERFFRVDRGRARDDGGVGLGLAIVKHILGRHESELTVSSEPGKGSKFSCRFPVRRIAF